MCEIVSVQKESSVLSVPPGDRNKREKSMKRPDFSAVNENTVVMNKEAALHVVTHTLIVLSDEPLNSQSP